MPTYEYSCLDCSHVYEKREGFDAAALQECPACGGTARRVLHAAPIVFKGSGFYVTDSRTFTPEAESEAKVDSAKPESAKPSDDAGTKDSEPAAAS